MKILTGWCSALCLSVSTIYAQATNDLNAQLQQLQEQQHRMREQFEQQLREQQAQIDLLKSQLATAQTNELPPAAGPAWDPTQPVRLGSGSAYMDIGLVGTVAIGASTADDIEGGTQPGGHDPNQRGFTFQGAEVNFTGAVDPYFRGNVNVLFSVDSEGESFVELEEGWLETISLPGNLQLRAGQLLTSFGRHNTQHPHQWSFVDAPLANALFLGPDGLRNPGAQISWLAPVPFFAEVSLGVQNSHGETAAPFRSSGHHHGTSEDHLELPFGFRHPDNDRGVGGPGDLLYSPRLAMSFDLTDSQTLLIGASGAFGPNSSGGSGDTMTQIYGVDLYWKWKPATAHGGFPFLSWQTEAILRRYELGRFNWDENGNGLADEGEVVDPDTGLPAVLGRETVTDYGFYSQVLWGFRKGWVAGLRWDCIFGERADYESRGLLLDGAG